MEPAPPLSPCCVPVSRQERPLPAPSRGPEGELRVSELRMSDKGLTLELGKIWVDEVLSSGGTLGGNSMKVEQCSRD